MSAQSDVELRLDSEKLIIDVDGFEGPLDLLLTLSRSQKVDLRHISVLQLARQYLVFVEEARKLRIELAADYLVMAAWLAFLKSRLLLPPEPSDEGPSGAELAAHLAFQLQRLEAMRKASAQLMALDQLGLQRFVRGAPEVRGQSKKVTYTASLLDLMQAYAKTRTRDDFRPFVLDRGAILSMEDALESLRHIVGKVTQWTDISGFLPEGWDVDPKRRRTAMAATFAASLELVKAGKLELRQADTFAPIQMRDHVSDT